MDGIKAHCMGMEFPKRDTDGPKVTWLPAGAFKDGDIVTFGSDPMRWVVDQVTESASGIKAFRIQPQEKTSAKVPNR